MSLNLCAQVFKSHGINYIPVFLKIIMKLTKTITFLPIIVISNVELGFLFHADPDFGFRIPDTGFFEKNYLI